MDRTKELPVVGRAVLVEPDLRTLGSALNRRIEAWFQDPEHEREYQEWKKERERAAG